MGYFDYQNMYGGQKSPPPVDFRKLENCGTEHPREG